MIQIRQSKQENIHKERMSKRAQISKIFNEMQSNTRKSKTSKLSSVLAFILLASTGILLAEQPNKPPPPRHTKQPRQQQFQR